MKKYDIINALSAKYGYRRFLEISTPTTGFTFGKIDRRNLEVCHRLVYNSPDHHDDGQPTTYRSAHEVADVLLRAISDPDAAQGSYDCIFVDPFHTYKSTAVDLAGAFALLEDGGAIVVHDCNPANADMAFPTFKKGGWCGVTYAAYLDFVMCRGNLRYLTVDCDHGCGVLFKRTAGTDDEAAARARDRLWFEWELRRGDDDARFAFFEQNRTALLRLVSPEEFLSREELTVPHEPPAPAPVLLQAAAARPGVPTPPPAAPPAAPAPPQPLRTRWWESRLIVRHINRTFCGKDVEGTDGGDIEVLRTLAASRPFARAVSIGAGNGHHEVRLLQSGLVEELDLFEMSATRAESARHRAANAGVGQRLHIHVEDAFARPVQPRYQLVYWKDSLHDMPSAANALQWTCDVLEDGGAFFMNDFVAESRMQYTDRQLDMVERARIALGDRYLRNPRAPDQMLPTRPKRPKLAKMIQNKPTDCADSGNILSAVRTVFPDATITPTGGIVYYLALNDVLAHLDDTQDETLLRAMLLADDFCIQAGETLYAVAHGRKA